MAIRAERENRNNTVPSFMEMKALMPEIYAVYMEKAVVRNPIFPYPDGHKSSKASKALNARRMQLQKAVKRQVESGISATFAPSTI